MTAWATIGPLWDRALAGDAARVLDEVGPAADAPALGGFAAFVQLLLCRYRDGAATVEGMMPQASDALDTVYLGALRLLAAGMHDVVVLPADAESFESLAERLPLDHPELLLIAHPLIEAGMATGRFADVERLVPAVLAAAPAASSSDRVATWIRLQRLRSLLFQGRLDAVIIEGAELAATPAVSSDEQARMLIDALSCYATAQLGDRATVTQLATRVLDRAAPVETYVQVGACLLVAWSLSTIGQVQRAAALLLATAGGASLPRIKTWDRGFGYELLTAAALQRGELEAARGWVARAAPLARFAVAAPSVGRAQSMLAGAEGDHDAAMTRALTSALTDAQAGSLIDELRARVILADALGRAGLHSRAAETLGQAARDADRLGAGAVRRQASRRLRTLSASSGLEGGWESLTDRQREIAGLAAEGHSNRTIAATLFISERSVQGHVTRVLKALGVSSRSALPARATTVFIDEPGPLTDRQRDVARLVAQGLSNQAICDRLGISIKTVEKHVSEILDRWDVTSRTAIARIVAGAQRA